MPSVDIAIVFEPEPTDTNRNPFQNTQLPCEVKG